MGLFMGLLWEQSSVPSGKGMESEVVNRIVFL